MQKFDQLTGVAAPLNILNIDTDMIIPKQFLKTIKRSGLGVSGFGCLFRPSLGLACVRTRSGGAPK